MKIDPAKTSVVILSDARLMVAPELLLWLLDVGIPRINILVSSGNDRDQSVAYNWAVSRSICMRVEHCLFADCDVRPDVKLTAPLLEVPYDFTCARTDTGTDGWKEDYAFHTGLWIARADSLRKIRAPWFGWETKPDGSEIVGCVCNWFSKKAIAAGMSIGNSGWARHVPRVRLDMPHCVALR